MSQQVTIRGIGFNATHGWRVNTQYLYPDGSLVWLPSPDQTFLSANAPAYQPRSNNNLLPTFTRTDLSLLPSIILPENSRSSLLPLFAPLVDRTNGGGPSNPPTTPPSGGPPSIAGDPVAVARLAIQYWNRSQAIQMVAIAGAESSYNSNAAGDSAASGYTCNGYWSYGLYQVNMNAHYTRLQQLTGSSNTCDWATWLQNPSNNTFFANELSSGGTYLVPWTMYLRGADPNFPNYHQPNPPHHADGGTCYLEYINIATQAVDQAIAERGF